MKKARAPSPQDGNNLWKEAHPPGGHAPCSVRRAGVTLLEALLRNGRHLGRCGSLSPSRGKARGGPESQPTCASRAGGPGELGNGAQAPGCAGLSSLQLHELATEGVRAKRIGVTTSPRGSHRPWGWMVSCAAKADLALTRESLVEVASARKATSPGVLSAGASTLAGRPQPGSRRSGAVLVDRIGRRNRRRPGDAPRKRGSAGDAGDGKALWSVEARHL